jgi:hypothetical protein
LAGGFSNNMKNRFTKEFIFIFANRLLREAGFSDEKIENDLDNLIYEAGESKSPAKAGPQEATGGPGIFRVEHYYLFL